MNKNNFKNLLKLSNEFDNKSNKSLSDKTILSKSELLNKKTLFIDESILNKINEAKLKYNNITNQLKEIDEKLNKLIKNNL